MKQKIFTLILAAGLALGAQAADVVSIVFDGTTATVSVPTSITDVTYTVTGANVVITSATTSKEYTYRVSGSSDDGSLIINGQYKLSLVLDGLTLTNNHSGAAIDIECGKRISVEVVDETVTTLTDASAGAQKGAFYFKGHPEFKGAGTLNVTGRLKHAIAAKEYIELKRSFGTINILGAVGDGIHCGRGVQDAEKNYFLMEGGVVNMTGVQGDGIDADDYGAIRLKGGGVSTTVADGATGIKADSTILISGATVNISVPGNDAEGIRSRYSTTISGGTIDISVAGDGSKGIKSKNNTNADATVLGGGLLTIAGGTINVTASGGSITDETGDTDRCIAISTDADLLQTGGTVELTAQGTEAATHNVKGTEQHTGGTWLTTRQPWVVNALATHYDMTIFATLAIDGTVVSDYSQLAVGAFFGDACGGCATVVDDYLILRVRSNEQTADALSFRLYDYATATEQSLQSAAEVTFSADSTVGTPSEPLLLWVGTAPDGVASVVAPAQSAACYDLQGRRVSPTQLRTGLYVRNGKKWFVR